MNFSMPVWYLATKSCCSNFLSKLFRNKVYRERRDQTKAQKQRRDTDKIYIGNQMTLNLSTIHHHHHTD